MANFSDGSSFSFKEILTVVSILVSILVLLYAWRKDRVLKKKEYADRIRHASGLVTAKLERWRELALRFFDDVQPLITDADTMLIKEQKAILTRDFLWRGLVTARAASTRRILEEQIEIAYADLYGYDARIRTLFTSAVHLLREIDESTFGEVLEETQANVLNLSGAEGEVQSAHLGNALRETCADLASQLGSKLDEVLVPFREEMIKLIEANDSDIFNKRVEISSPEKVFHDVKECRGNNKLDKLKKLPTRGTPADWWRSV